MGPATLQKKRRAMPDESEPMAKRGNEKSCRQQNSLTYHGDVITFLQDGDMMFRQRTYEE